MFETILPWLFLIVLFGAVFVVLAYGQPKHYLVGFLLSIAFVFSLLVQDFVSKDIKYIIYTVNDIIYTSILFSISVKIYSGRISIYERWAFFIGVLYVVATMSHLLNEFQAPVFNVDNNYFAINNIVYFMSLATLFVSAVPKSFKDARDILRIKLIFLLSGLLPRVISTFQRALFAPKTPLKREDTAQK